MDQDTQDLIDRIANGEEKLLSRNEICKRLNVPLVTFDKWRRTPSKDKPCENRFPNPDLYIGGSPRWSMTSFKKWIETCLLKA